MKEAVTKYPVHPIIKKRWSGRAFSEKSITQDTLNQILEAASWAPSSMNEQPWRYRYAFKETDAFKRMVSCLSAGNRSWAKKAAVLILSIAKTNLGETDNVNRHAWHDVGAANAHLFFEATSLGIRGHMMAGFDYDKTIEMFKLPLELEPVAFIALSYPGNVDELEEPFKSREVTPRNRKSLEFFAQLEK